MNRTKEQMQAIATGMDNVLNGQGEKKFGFVVLVFPMNGKEGNRTNYVSNGNRSEVISAMKEIVERLDK